MSRMAEDGFVERMREALTTAARANLPVIQHAEDTRLTGGCSMNAGAVAFRLGLRGMPVEAESGLVERDLRLLAQVKDARVAGGECREFWGWLDLAEIVQQLADGDRGVADEAGVLDVAVGRCTGRRSA